MRIQQKFIFFLLTICGLVSCSKTGENSTSGTPGLYLIKENSRYGYMDQTGKLVVSPAFDYAWDLKDGMARFKDKGKYGFINDKGEIVVKPEFAYADDFKDGFARVNIKDTVVMDIHFDGYTLNEGWTFVDKKGIVFTETFAKAEYLRTGLAQVKDDPSYESAWAYATLTEGKLYKQDRNTEAIFTFNGHATAPASDSETRKIGTINIREEWVIQPSFDAIEPYSEGLAAAKKDNAYGYIDTNGKWVYQRIVPVNENYYLTTDFRAFSNGLAAVKIGENAYIYIAKDGKQAINQKFKSAGSFNKEGYAVVSSDAGTGLIDKSGNFIIKPNLEIVSADNGIVIYRSNNRYGAKSLKDQKDIVPAQYDNIELVGGVLRLVNKGATFGYIDKSGNYAIAPQYETAWEFKNGKAIVQQKEKYLYIDKSGKIIGHVPEAYQPYYYGQEALMYAAEENRKYGFAKPGQDGFAIAPTFDFATDFEGNIARINIGASFDDEAWSYSGGKWGLINASGASVVPASYELIMPFYDNVAMFNSGGQASYNICEGDCMEAVYYTINGGKWGLLDAAGKIIADAKYDQLIPFGKNYLASADSTFTLLNNAGKEIYPATLTVWYDYEGAGGPPDFRNLKFIKAGENGKTGVISSGGKWLVEPKHDDISFPEGSESPFSEGLVIVKEGELWGAADASGQVVIAPAYDEMRPFKGAYAAVSLNGLWGFIDKSGNLVVEPKFSAVRDFQNDVAIVQPAADGLEGVIDTSGKLIFQPEEGLTFDYSGFLNGMCVIHGTIQSKTAEYPVAKSGVINSKGKVIFNKTALDDVKINHNGLIYAIKNGKWALASPDGAMLTGYNYNWIEPYNGQELIGVNVGGELIYPEYGESEEIYGGRFGYIDKTGLIKIPLKFSEIRAFSDGLAPARTSEDLDEIGYVDLNGKTIRELKK